MSKLAHSNEDTMLGIEFRKFGMSRITPPPAWPMCEAATPPKWYRPEGGKCPYRAYWQMPDGKKLCRIHAGKACDDETPNLKQPPKGE